MITTRHENKDIDEVRYIELAGEYQEPMAVGCYGSAGSGKTHLCATAPGPIGAIPLDRKTRMTLLKIKKETGVSIIVPDQDFIRHAEPMLIAVIPPLCADTNKKIKLKGDMPRCCAIHYYRWHLNRIKHCIFTFAEMEKIRTIILDSGSQLWQDILFAHFGRAERIMPRDRGAANQEMIDILSSISHKNVIITHRAKEIWKNDKPSGKFEWEGFAHLGYHCNVIVEMKRAEKSGAFSMDVVMCQANSELHGEAGKASETLLQDEAITFQNLALKVYPDSDESFWE